jgi:hypothetical protein
MIEGRGTDLAMITVNQQWIIRIVENNLHDRMHDGLGNLNLFRPFHFNDKVYVQSVRLVWPRIKTRTSLIEKLTANSIAFHERCKMLREWIFLHEGATQDQNMSFVKSCHHLQNGLQTEGLEEILIYFAGETATED